MRIRSQRGFSLMEIMIAGVLIAGMAATYASIDVTVNQLINNEHVARYNSCRNLLETAYQQVTAANWEDPSWYIRDGMDSFDAVDSYGTVSYPVKWTTNDVVGRDYRSFSAATHGSG